MTLLQHHELFRRGVRHADRVVRRAPPAGEGVHEDQRGHAVRVGRGQQHRHRAALRVADDRRLPRASRIQREQRVVHPFLERRQRLERDRVRDAGAALVEADDAADPGQALQVLRAGRLVPHGIDVPAPARDEQDVAGPVTEDLVRDVAAVRFRVPRLRANHARSGARGRSSWEGLRRGAAVHSIRARSDGVNAARGKRWESTSRNRDAVRRRLPRPTWRAASSASSATAAAHCSWSGPPIGGSPSHSAS